MNRCEYQDLLSQYMDEQLDAQMANCLEQHLPLCPQCRRELKQLKALRQLCLDLPEQDVPEGLHDKIMNRVRSNGSRKSLGWVRHAIIPLAAAILIFLIGRGIPDILGSSKTAQDSVRPESAMMAMPIDSGSKTDEDMSSEDDVKLKGKVEAPLPAEKPELENGIAEDSAGEVPAAGDADAANNKTTGSNQATSSNLVKSMNRDTADTEAKTEFSGQLEKPSYLKYGIVIVLIVGLGFAFIWALIKKTSKK